jgi:hypothetical protein
VHSSVKSLIILAFSLSYLIGPFLSFVAKSLASGPHLAKRHTTTYSTLSYLSTIAGIGIEVDAAGIGIPASCISVRYKSIPVPDWVPIFRYQTGSGIGIFVHSGTGLTGCQTVRHSGIQERCTPSRSILLAVKGDTPCTSILLAVVRDTMCTSILLAIIGSGM